MRVKSRAQAWALLQIAIKNDALRLGHGLPLFFRLRFAKSKAQRVSQPFPRRAA